MARPKRAPDEKQLSPAEWQMMRILWRIGRASVRQVLEEDLKKRNRDYRTILDGTHPAEWRTVSRLVIG